MANIAVQLGATHKLDLTSDVTHLLVGDIDTPKYKYVAKEREDVKVLRPGWIEAVRQSWIEGGETDVGELEKQYRLPPLSGLTICVTGFEDLAFRTELQQAINANGATYKGDLTKSVSHLIAKAAEGNKYSHAIQWGIRTVGLQWLKDSLQRGMTLEESLYDPRLPISEQGKNAWVKRCDVVATLGKRAREGEAIGNGSRKLRRTVSARLLSQYDGLWTDIVGGGFEQKGEERNQWDDAYHEPSAPAIDREATRPTSPTMDSVDPLLPTPSLSQMVSETTRGLFYGMSFLLRGFDEKEVRTGVECGPNLC